MTEFKSKTPELSENALLQSVANKIKLVTGIDIMTDKIPFRIDVTNGKLVGFNIERKLTPTEINQLLAEFPKLELK